MTRIDEQYQPPDERQLEEMRIRHHQWGVTLILEAFANYKGGPAPVEHTADPHASSARAFQSADGHGDSWDGDTAPMCRACGSNAETCRHSQIIRRLIK